MKWIFPQTSRGSFSAVSTPILQVNTRWKALDEIYKLRILLHRSDFKIPVKNRQHFFREWKNELIFFPIFSVEFCIFSAKFWWLFFQISRQIPEKSDVCRFSIKFAIFKKKIAEIFEICENYSVLFNIIQSCPYSWCGYFETSEVRNERSCERGEVQPEQDRHAVPKLISSTNSSGRLSHGWWQWSSETFLKVSEYRSRFL